MLYNAEENTLSYFHNKKYIGTPFKNVKGDKLYFLTEGCHLGYFEIVDDVELPSDKELEKALQDNEKLNAKDVWFITLKYT